MDCQSPHPVSGDGPTKHKGFSALWRPPRGAVCGHRRAKRFDAAHFLHQGKTECHYANGTAGEVRLLQRYIYDRQEFVRFDSRRGEFEAVSELCKEWAPYWNSRKEILDDVRASVDSFCRHNYGVLHGVPIMGRKGGRQHGDFSLKGAIGLLAAEPTVTISPTKGDPLAHHALLVCTAAGYYPLGVKITWLKNGQEQTEGVGYAEELQNADWTYQYQVMLETLPQRGDLYACQVEHSSLKEPITVQWEPQTSVSARSKVWTGAVGAVLGQVFVAVGLSLYLKNKKDNYINSGLIVNII
ncbi:UNVERIFIED_CONTAM: hypothetical protein K2H54_067031 [Gekko kuhli]